MLNLVIFIFFISATLSLIAWLFIFLHPARPWDFQPVGDDCDPPPMPPDFQWPPVAIIVPARNEAEFYVGMVASDRKADILASWARMRVSLLQSPTYQGGRRGW